MKIIVSAIFFSLIACVSAYSQIPKIQPYITTPDNNIIPPHSVENVEFVRTYKSNPTSLVKIMQDYCTGIVDFETKVFVCSEIKFTIDMWCNKDTYVEPFGRARVEIEEKLCSSKAEIDKFWYEKLSDDKERNDNYIPWRLAYDMVSSPGSNPIRIEDLSRSDNIKGMFALWTARGERFARRTKCAGDISLLPSDSEERFCSYRIAVAGFGSPQSDSPRCGNGMDVALREDEFETIKKDIGIGFKSGGLKGAVIGLFVGVVEMQANRGIKGTKNAPAGCAPVCVFVPMGYSISKLVPFASADVDGHMIQMPWGPTKGDFKPERSEFSEFKTSSSELGSTICSIYKNWSGRDIRDAQILAVAKKN